MPSRAGSYKRMAVWSIIVLSLFLATTRQGASQLRGSVASDVQGWLRTWRRQLTEGNSSEPSPAPTPLAAPVTPLPYDSSCPPGCADKGVCNEELGRCDCPRHWVGPSCSEPQPNLRPLCADYGFTLSQCRQTSPCFNSCNQRGECIAGICHCDPGFWGMDCALSRGPDGTLQLLEGQGYVPRKDGIKIYVYELPPNMTSWFNIRRIDRPLHMLFWQRLMSAGLRTANGEEADYYFIPVNTRTEMAPGHLAWILRYIKITWPWWSRDNGNRHLIIHTGDMGIHELPPDLRRDFNSSFSNITWLTHWGLHTYHPVAKWHPASRPGKDIVIPVMITAPGFHMSPLNPAVARRAAKKGTLLKRTGTMFFAGRVCGDRKNPDPNTARCSPARPDYSGGVRQAVFQRYHNFTGFKVAVSSKTYLEDISSHKFCLAPTGGGHGKRQVLVALMGCIPVTITDGVHQPFEPELDWGAFSVPVAEADIPRLHDILGNVSDERVAEMQSRLHCVAQHMFYSSSLGAIVGEDGRYDAFETIIEILRMRRDYPGVPPEQYREVDEHFRKFSDCDLGPPTRGLLCQQGPERLEKDLETCAECHRRVVHLRTGSSFFSWAGGMVCCSELKMAKCPRIWP